MSETGHDGTGQDMRAENLKRAGYDMVMVFPECYGTGYGRISSWILSYPVT